jgi:RNA polymerase sigma factor (sigma-70 family)
METTIEHTEGLLARLCEGDRIALARVTRMVTRRLAGLGAYDLRDDWGDVCQEIVWSLVKAARAGRAPSDEKLGAYVSRAVWNRFASLLRRRQLRNGEYRAENSTSPASNGSELPDTDNRMDIDRVNARQALARLPRPSQELLCARYVEGRSIDELVRASGRSRASVNRDLAKARAEFATLLGLASAPSSSGRVAPCGEIDATITNGRGEADRS